MSSSAEARVAARARLLREMFPDQRACADCGWLADGGDEPCPRCGASRWIDLHDGAGPVLLRRAEATRAIELSGAASRFHDGMIAALIVTAMVLAGIFLVVSPPALIVGLAPLVLAVAGGIRLVRRFARRMQVRSEAYARSPRRLHEPAPAALALNPGLHRGPAQVRGGLLKAPVSGLPCLAWTVHARVQSEGRWQEMVADTRSAAFVLDGVEVPADSVEVVGPTEDTRFPELDAVARQRVRRFLRARGCTTDEGAWELSEACIPADGEVELDGRGGLDRALRLRALASTEGVAPYR